jgi:sulfhydrogenase subunit beta (sulfur reductase)
VLRAPTPRGGPVTDAPDTVVMTVEEFDRLIGALNERYDVRGPVVRSGALVTGPVRGVRDLPGGWHDEHGPGHYRLTEGDDEELFGWSLGPASWKPELLPPHQVLWRSQGRGENVRFVEPTPASRDLALVGVRPCDVAAIRILARVLSGGEHPDPHFSRRHRGLVLIAVECARPSSTCFCDSMGTGPALDVDVESPVDLAVTELFGPHRFLVRAGSPTGARLLEGRRTTAASVEDWTARTDVVAASRAAMVRHVDTDNLAAVLEECVEDPHWAEIAERCLSCANCTMVCPTCFCSDIADVTDLDGDTQRQRHWSSCFDLDHSFLHGGPVRSSPSSRYRQWMTHKFSTWWPQFDSSGCVGCGRCVTWCPVGIDVTVELARFRQHHEAGRP